jgi:hypothetical protein
MELMIQIYFFSGQRYIKSGQTHRNLLGFSEDNRYFSLNPALSGRIKN